VKTGNSKLLVESRVPLIKG